MKKTTISRIPAFTAVGMASVLTLTACSGSETYDFTYGLEEAPGSIKFTIPRDLADLNDEYVENRIFESVTLTAVTPEDDASGCAVEYSFDYADDGLERLVEYVENTNAVRNGDETVEERVAYRLTYENLEGIELAEDFSSAVVPVSCAASPSENDGEAVLVSFDYIADDEVEYFADAYITVMRGAGKDYELYVHDADVYDWQVDSNGNWIKK